jgi:hypothetical protein
MHYTQFKITDPASRQRKRPTSLNQKLSKNNSRKEEKLVAGPKGVPDTKTDWPTDRRSYYSFNLNLTATPSADFDYSRPAIAINSRPITSRAPPQASHNASGVFTVRVNKSAYHLQSSNL